MTPNHKLTNVIKGRKVVGTANADGKMTVSFDDGSTMKIKTGNADPGNANQGNANANNLDANAATSSTRLPESVAPNAPTANASTSAQPHATQSGSWFGKLAHAFSGDDSNQNAATENANTQNAETLPANAPIISPNAVSTNVVSSNSASTGGNVKSVWQNETTLTLQFDDGSKMEIPIAEATSSVMLRDKSNMMEYAD